MLAATTQARKDNRKGNAEAIPDDGSVSGFFGQQCLELLDRRIACQWFADNVIPGWMCFWWAVVLLSLGGSLCGVAFDKLGGRKDWEFGREPSVRQLSQDFGDGVELNLHFSDEEPENGRKASSKDQRRLNKRLATFTGGAVLAPFLAHVRACVGHWSTYEWEKEWLDWMYGFVLEEGQPYTAPVWLGEFGYANQGVYWQQLIRYLSDRDMDFGYWALNGIKYGEGYINDKTGFFNIWTGCETLLRPMQGGNCEASLGTWAAEGGQYGRWDRLAQDGTPNTCVYSVDSHGTCDQYCKARGRACVKAAPFQSESDNCSLTSPDVSSLPENGCSQDLSAQVCVCTKQLWVWDEETFGLLDRDYMKVKTAWRIRDLQAIAQSPASYVPREIGCVDDVIGNVCDDANKPKEKVIDTEILAY
eukprot:TRINITY_DN24686_c0_g1_i2.p1 TRINITY_DN24686_c0_g1~~TRINITY_DN24686_c0_g1_i2.p1  ORF type:complete len:417 (+),score=85.03 TRINITY_DN24686_c0_g1_i2:104-1354(+)